MRPMYGMATWHVLVSDIAIPMGIHPRAQHVWQEIQGTALPSCYAQPDRCTHTLQAKAINACPYILHVSPYLTWHAHGQSYWLYVTWMYAPTRAACLTGNTGETLTPPPATQPMQYEYNTQQMQARYSRHAHMNETNSALVYAFGHLHPALRSYTFMCTAQKPSKKRVADAIRRHRA